jgi:hypothetical protein
MITYERKRKYLVSIRVYDMNILGKEIYYFSYFCDLFASVPEK